MALTLKAKITASKNGVTVQNVTETFALGDMTGDEMVQGVLLLSNTDATAVPTGSVATASAYWVLLRNMDATNTIEVIDNDGSADRDIADMGPGEVYGPVRLRASHTLKVQGASGDQVEYVVVER
jgi:hypothetical protein